jgi:exopolyphosphatase/guanosine-5'-triphosphate,3'-diphosphate pyrophosphatase
MDIGAVDIGTNSVRLLVARTRGSDLPLQTLVRAGEACRLGRGLHRTGMIDGEMVERACEVVARMVERARSEGAERIIVAATQALRVASNRDEVRERIAQAAGLPVRILSGEEEARLTYGAVIESLGSAAARHACVVFDLGGGSTEIASGVGRDVGRFASIPMGAVSLTERFLGDRPADHDGITGLDRHVEAALAQHCRDYPSDPAIFAGVGGTVTVLASLFLDLPRYDPGRIDGCAIPAADVGRLVERLTWMDPESRRRILVMGEGRADIIAAGARAVLAMLRFFKARTLTASSQGLRYALARLAAEEAAPNA